MIAGDRTRYFIITVGRTGSSLLATILADAGAQFGAEIPAQWNPRDGVMEDPEIVAAQRHYRRAYDIDMGRRYKLLPFYEARLRRTLGRRRLARALARGQYVKIDNLDLVVQPAFKLGYVPKIILSYRRYEEAAMSLLVGRTHTGADELGDEYVRVYRQGLMLLHAFGGCAVSQDQVLAPDDGAWSRALGTLTGLAPSALLEAAQKRRANIAKGNPPPVLYPDAHRIYLEMERLRGCVVEPSPQALRVLRDRGDA